MIQFIEYLKVPNLSRKKNTTFDLSNDNNSNHFSYNQVKEGQTHGLMLMSQSPNRPKAWLCSVINLLINIK